MIRVSLEGDTGDGLINELARRAREAEEIAINAKSQKRQAWHRGQASAFKEALEITDAALRCDKTGSPVELRQYDRIVQVRNL